ncbi:hypothetical protein ACN1JM_000356 [Bacillus pacificus]
MDMNRCGTCEQWGNENHSHLHIEKTVEGLLEMRDLEQSQTTLEAEKVDLSEAIIYRYVWASADLFKMSSSQSIASVAHCLCIDCINYSLSFVPHYGDGAYCTTNGELKKESPRVMHTHGIDIRGMNYRVLMRIKDTSNFKKIKNTAGVTRSIPVGQKLHKGMLVFSDENAIKIIGFQQWDGEKWEDVLLDDLKGVS